MEAAWRAGDARPRLGGASGCGEDTGRAPHVQARRYRLAAGAPGIWCTDPNEAAWRSPSLPAYFCTVRTRAAPGTGSRPRHPGPPTPRPILDRFPVLVTDGTERAALAVVRSLGAAGHEVHVCAQRSRSLAGASRWCRGQERVPSSLVDPGGFAEAVRQQVEAQGIRLLVPISEASILALLQDGSPPIPLACPPRGLDAFLRVVDKPEVLRRAQDLGIAVPEQVELERAGQPLGTTPPFPLVIKPGRSVAGDPGSRSRFSVLHAADGRQLEHHLATLPDTAYPLLLQQRIVGPGIGVFVLLWDGEVRASSGHRRLREKPPAGGVSVYREAVVPPPELLESSLHLLRSLEWEGPAMVEYKVDEASGTPYLMEINGRFWGSLQLAIDAGVDFPRILVDLARGIDPGPPPALRAGVRSRWWLGEADHLLARLRKSTRELNLPPDSPGRWAALVDFFRTHPQDRSEVFRLSDPGPGFRELLDWFLRR